MVLVVGIYIYIYKTQEIQTSYLHICKFYKMNEFWICQATLFLDYISLNDLKLKSLTLFHELKIKLQSLLFPVPLDTYFMPILSNWKYVFMSLNY